MRGAMAATMAATPDAGKRSLYNNQLRDLKEIRSRLLENAAASGQWDTSTVRTMSSTQALTKAINEQKLTLRQARKAGTEMFRQAIKEQEALRNSMLTQFTGNAYGRGQADLIIPRNLTREMGSVRTQLGFASAALSSISQQTINWGKNTQWAGRQIMVGITVPLGIAAALAGKMAYDVDKAFTRMAKVYDTTAETAKGQERELAALRETSLASATRMAKVYGATLKDSIDIQSQLAATGLTGQGLFQASEQVSRVSFLGDLDKQQAIDTTIALQTAFKMSNEELAESFDFMNQVENETVLSIKDIAEAVPRAASALSSLGGTVQEMTVMLTAMKEAGVDPQEAANALKSATSRLLSPSGPAKDYFKKAFDINLTEVVADAKGNIYKLMQDLSKMTADFEPFKVQQGINELFGTYQFNRLTALWTNMGSAINDAGEATNQTGRAMKIMGMDAADWAATAERETERMQKSISGRFKIAVETLKAELVPLGDSVLAVLLPVIEGITNLIQGFNNLSGFAKGAILTILGVVAIVGPMVMIAGILGNLIGQAGKGIAAIGTFITRFKMLTPEQRVADLLARRTGSAWDAQASSAAILTNSINTLTASMERQAVAQGLMAKISPAVAATATTAAVPMTARIGNRNVVQNPGGRARYGPGSGNDARGRPLEGRMLNPNDAILLGAAMQNMRSMEQSSERTKANWGKITGAVGGLAIGAMAMKSMASSSGDILSTMMNVAMVAMSLSMLGVTFKGLGGILSKALLPLTAIMNRGVIGKMGKTISNGLAKPFGSIGAKLAGRSGIAGGLGKVGTIIARVIPQALKLFGPIGVIAGAIGIIVAVNNKMGELEKRQKNINKSAQQWSEILGYTYQAGNMALEEEDKSTYESRIDDVKKLEEANGDLVDKLKEAKDAGDGFQSVWKVALAEGLKVVSSGGTAQQAEEAIKIALQAADVPETEIDNVMLRLNGIDLSNPDEVRSQLMSQVRDAITNVKGDDDAGWFRSMFGGNVSGEARAAGQQVGQQFADGLQNASTKQQKAKLIIDMQHQLDEQFDPDFTKLDNKYGEAFDQLGIKSMQTLTAVWKDPSRRTALRKAIRETTGEESVEGVRPTIDKYQEMLDTIFDGFGNEYGATADDIEEWQDDFAGMHGLFKLIGVSAGDAETDVAGFGDAAEGAANDASKLEGVADAIASALMNIDAGSFVSSMQQRFSGTINGIASEADRLRNEQQAEELAAMERSGEITQQGYENRQKSMDKAHDGEQKALDKHHDDLEKAEEDFYDGQKKWYEDAIDQVKDQASTKIDGIKAVMDQEDKAEEQRQRIFEAEQRRLQRLNELNNANVDFNAALNSGDLDEAARISNNTASQVGQWGIEDSQRSGEEARAKRKEAQQAEIDQIEKDRDARVEALEAEKERIDAEKESRLAALKEVREAESEALKQSQEDAKEALRVSQESDRERTRVAVEQRRKEQEANNRSLELQKAALMAAIPTSEEGLKEWIGKMEALYGGFGTDLTAAGTGWGQIIGDQLKWNIASSAAALQSEISWKAIGEYISKQLGEGSGMSFDQIKTFLESGKWPVGAIPSGTAWDPGVEAMKARGYTPLGNGRYRGPNGGVIFEHTGGQVNPTWSSKDRTGIPRSASLYPSEVPTVLKRGEFVVNQNASRKHLDLLNDINGGKVSPGDMRMDGAAGPQVRHSGGIIAGMTGMAAFYGAAMAKVAQMVAAEKIAQMTGKTIKGYTETGVRSGGDMAGGVFTPGSGKYPARVMGKESANTTAAKQFVQQKWGGKINGVGTVGSRSITSDHPWGKALDVMITKPGAYHYKQPGGIALGTEIASHFVNNPDQFGTKYVIWRDRITEGKGWKPYGHPSGGGGDTLQHRDHPHISLKHKGGQIPSLRVGGEALYDNTLANLHKKETVLTAPLSNSLQRGIDRLDSGGYQTQLTIDLRGATVRDDTVEKIRGVIREYHEEKESKLGRSRKLTD